MHISYTFMHYKRKSQHSKNPKQKSKVEISKGKDAAAPSEPVNS